MNARLLKTGLYLLIATSFLVTARNTYAQKYGNVWHFGDHAGIDFKTCSPEVISNSSMAGFEGCATVCDVNGNLLFYTNSDVVWNKFNNVMTNGNLISSSGTISQVLIVPKPGLQTEFYIITSKIQASGTLSLRYHIVDMTQNSGLGAVVSSNNVITTWNVTEQIAATTHANGNDIWIMTHEYGTDKFLAFLLTPNGINLSPVISSVGPAHIPCTSNINSRGEIKFSPDCRRIAFNGNGVGSNSSSNILALFDFDNSTGTVSNVINLPYSNGEFGLAFSPDNSKLYGSTWKAFAFGAGEYNYIYQFDLSSGIPSMIINSKVIIDSVPSINVFGSMKTGPDGRIYIARMNSGYLGVINDPNLSGLSCNYVANGFYLGGNTSTYGLNNYIEYQNYCSPATGIYSLNTDESFSIVPNPVSDQVIINFSKDLIDASLSIYSSAGVLMKRYYEFSGNKIQLDKQDLPPGIYFISVFDRNFKFENKKMIILE